MAEFSELPHDASQPEQHALPVRFNHLGTNFESPIADNHMALLQAKIADPRRLPNAFDLIDVIGCELKDIEAQKTYVMGEKDAFNTAVRSLKRVQKTVVDAAAQDFESIDDGDRSAVYEYLDRHLERWKTKADDQNSTAPLREEAQGNVQVITELRDHIFEQKHTDEDIKEGALDAEAFANAFATTEDGYEVREETAVPEYKFTPILALDVLNDLRGKGEITDDDIQSLFNSTVMDIGATKEQFEKDNPGRSTAIQYAVWYYANHQDEPDLEKKKIYVSQLPDTQTNVGFEPPDRALPEGTRRFTFTLSGDPEDPRDLSINAKYVDDFDTVYEDSKNAQLTINKLYSGDEEFRAKLDEWDNDAIEEVISAIRIIDRLRDYLRESNTNEQYTDDEVNTFETLDRLSAMILTKAGLQDGPEEEDEL